MPVLYISPASDRLVNTYIFPVSDSVRNLDPLDPPVPTQCCDLCMGDAAPRTLYNDIGRTSAFYDCSVFFLQFVPTVGWICAFASGDSTTVATTLVKSIGYFSN